MSVIESGRCGEIYHISTVQEEVTIARLVQMICTKMGKSFENAVNSIDENFGQDAIYSLNTEKIRNELNWKPSTGLEDGIDEVIEWVEQNWSVIKDLPHEYVHKI